MVERTLAAKVAESKAAFGSAIVYDPTTGAIVAMADVPHVNPDNPDGTAEEDRGSRAISAPFEPGSVQKVLTMAAVVDSGAAEPDDVFTVPDSIVRDGVAGRSKTSLRTRTGRSRCRASLPSRATSAR